jgi:hypothetical protein
MNLERENLHCSDESDLFEEVVFPEIHPTALSLSSLSFSLVFFEGVMIDEIADVVEVVVFCSFQNHFLRRENVSGWGSSLLHNPRILLLRGCELSEKITIIWWSKDSRAQNVSIMGIHHVTERIPQCCRD